MALRRHSRSQDGADGAAEAPQDTRMRHSETIVFMVPPNSHTVAQMWGVAQALSQCTSRGRHIDVTETPQ